MDSYPYFSLVFLTVSLYCFVLSSQTQHSKFSHVFNVLSYGAVGNGESNDAGAFQKGLECSLQSRGCTLPRCPCSEELFPYDSLIARSPVVLVPKNYSFMIHSLNFTGPCTNRLVFQIEGSLVAPDGPRSWAKNEDKRYWLVFIGINGMSMEGGGLVDGKGEKWWKLPCKPHRVRDDCVSIGGDSYNVDIKNITCKTGHGISIGSLGLNNSRECVSNITVRNSTIKHSDNGVRIKTWQGGSGTVSSVTFENIRMVMVRNPITINQYYCNNICGCVNQTSAIYITDISYKDIKGTYNATNHPVYNLACSDTVPCTNLTFIDVELRPGKGQTILKPFCWDAYGVARNTTPPVDCLARKFPKTLPYVDKCSKETPT